MKRRIFAILVLAIVGLYAGYRIYHHYMVTIPWYSLHAQLDRTSETFVNPDPAARGTLAIAFVGDSLLRVNNPNVPSIVGKKLLTRKRLHAVTVVNYAYSSLSSNDWQPSQRAEQLEAAKVAFNKAAVRYVVICLGMNDCRPPANTSPAQYAQNIRVIIQNLAAPGRVFYLSDVHCPQRQENTNDGNQNSSILIMQYREENRKLVDRKTILTGDRKSPAQIEAAPTLLKDGVHETQEGAQLMGENLAASIQ